MKWVNVSNVLHSIFNSNCVKGEVSIKVNVSNVWE
jgi:hypothetical protein